MSIGDCFSAGVVPHCFQSTTVCEQAPPGWTVYNMGVPTFLPGELRRPWRMASSPTLRRARTDGPRLVIELDHAAGLAWIEGREGLGLEIAGPDLHYRPAGARIVGESLVVEAVEVTEPVAARYAWAPFPSCSLVNAAGLPAAPFQVRVGGSPEQSDD